MDRAVKKGKILKHIYQDFHDQGSMCWEFLWIVRKKAWLKGIQEEGYKWEQVSDLLGFKISRV